VERKALETVHTRAQAQVRLASVESAWKGIAVSRFRLGQNAVCLPPALRFNRDVAAAEIERFGQAMRTDDAAGRVEELARLSGFTLLRHLGVPRDDLPALAEAAAERGGAKANPRPASAGDVLALFESVW